MFNNRVGKEFDIKDLIILIYHTSLISPISYKINKEIIKRIQDIILEFFF